MNVTCDTQTTLSQPPACPSSYYDYVSIRTGMNGVTIRRRLLSLPLVTGRAAPRHAIRCLSGGTSSPDNVIHGKRMALTRCIFTLLQLIVLNHLLNISFKSDCGLKNLHSVSTSQYILTTPDEIFKSMMQIS